MKLKKIENPWVLSYNELQNRCVKVKTADGVLRDVGFGLDGDYVVASVCANPGIVTVRRCGWTLLGWTFYEEVKPLVWEGECETGGVRKGFYIPIDQRLPAGFEYKKFHVVATEIVGGENVRDVDNVN